MVRTVEIARHSPIVYLPARTRDPLVTSDARRICSAAFVCQ
jgi:hypothetical protein